MARSTASGPVSSVYEDRIGTETNENEVTGYWAFLAGIGLGVLGLVVYFLTDAATMGRAAGYALAALAPAFIMAGAVLQFPLREMATYLAGVGLLMTLAAGAWFLVVFPGGWSTTTGNAGVIVTYIAGLGVIGMAGVIVPQEASEVVAATENVAPEAQPSKTTSEADAAEAEIHDLESEAESASAEIADLQSAAAQREAELDEVKAALEDTEADEAYLAAQLGSLRSSQSQFELYEDRGGQWRWRLRHSNGNLIAGGGQGYTRKESAQNGIQAVRRDGFGASVLLVESEDDLPDETSTDGFVFPGAAESQADFELYEDAAGEYRWRLVHENGNNIASSGEGYNSRDGAEHSIERIRTYVGPAEYLEADPRAIEIYADEEGQWRWRLVHRNGNILADSNEGFSGRSGARRSIDRIREEIDEMEIDVYEDEAGEFRWRLLGGNDGIQAGSGRGYSTQAGAAEAVENVREQLPAAELLDIGEAVFEVFEDEGVEWRWRLRHRNGQILAVSGQGYEDRSGAWAGIESVKRNAPDAGPEEN